MERVDDLIKMDKLISIIEREAQREIDDAKALASQELEVYKSELKSEFEKRRSEMLREHKTELEKIRKLFSSKKKALLHRYKSKLKDDLKKIIVEKIRERIESDVELRKGFLKYALEKLKGNTSDGMILECEERDVGLLKEIYDGEIRSGNVQGLAFVDRSGRYRVVYSIEEFISECLELLRKYISDKVGELG